MTYRLFGAERLEDVLGLYERAGWTAYLKDNDQLKRAFEQSLFVYGAFENEKLVGFVRCVGDGEHIVYIQDLLVDAAWQRRGIGKALMDEVKKRFSHVRMITLMTDAQDEAANAFYRAMGFRVCGENGLQTYFW